MKISCSRDDIKLGLTAVGSAVAARKVLPILGSVLLSANGDKLTLTASDLEMAITHVIRCKGEGDGFVAVPYKLLSSLVDELPSGTLSLACTGNLLELATERSSARINGQDGGDFPPVPDCSGGQVISIPVDELCRAIDLTVFAAAKEASRPVLCGVYIHTVDGMLQFASTDGHRLAVYRSTTQADDLSIIVPSRTMRTVGKLCKALNGGSDSDIIVRLTEPSRGGDIRAVEFMLGQTRVVSQLVSGTFPDYASLIPTKFRTTVTVETASFGQAARVAGATVRDTHGAICLEIDNGDMVVSGRGDEVGNSSTRIEIQVEGEQSARIAFQYRYLVELLSALTTLSVSAVTVSISGDTAPCLMSPVGIDEYKHVLMPCFVSDWGDAR